MKVSKIMCDRCDAEIKEHPIRIFPEVVDRKTGDIKPGIVRASWDGSLMNYDFCDECTEEIIQFCKAKPENQMLVMKEPTEKEIADIAEIIKKEPAVLLPAEEKKESNVSTKQSKPTVKELILEGKSKEEVIEITGCAPATYTQTKYCLKKDGIAIPKVAPSKTYKCSRAGEKCFYSRKIGPNVICDYIGVEGHSRGCDPENCTHFKKK